MARSISLRSTLILALIACALAAPVAFAQKDKKQSSDSQDVMERQRKQRQEVKKIYKEWVDKDVAYIITDAERSAFKKLVTDEEREQFIEAFWQRRDPDPDTDENEYKRNSITSASLMPTSTTPPASPAGRRIAVASTSPSASPIRSSRIRRAAFTTGRVITAAVRRPLIRLKSGSIATSRASAPASRSSLLTRRARANIASRARPTKRTRSRWFPAQDSR
jgi:hypothetical protein